MQKVVASADAAVADIPDGAVILMGGFGLCGIPENLIQALEAELLRRRFGPPIRLEVTEQMDEVTLDLLIAELDITDAMPRVIRVMMHVTSNRARADIVHVSLSGFGLKGARKDFPCYDLIAEGFVRFQRECSLIAVRSKDARTAFYPLVQNFHHQGILRLSLVPCQKLTGELQAQAVGYVAKILQELDYTGVLAVEFFVADNKLIANEMAPRVHNSGHWTMDGAETSQFENHIRAITGLPLGATNAIGASAMINLIGTVPDVHRMLKIPGSHLHLYGKEPREGRKLGHLNIRADSSDKLIELLQECKDLMPAETFQQFQQSCC